MFKRFAQDARVRIRTKTDENAFNEPIYTYSEIVMHNCLIKPEQTYNEPYNETRHEGHKVMYTIYVPKVYAHIDLENAEFYIHGEWLKAIGVPKHYDLCPTDYSCAVQVEQKHG